MDFFSALLILILSLLLSWLVNFAFSQIIPQIVAKTKSDTDDRIVAAIKTPITISILTGAFVLIFAPTSSQTAFLKYSINLVLTFLTALWSWALIKILDAVLDEIDHRFEKRITHHDLFPFFKSLIRIATFAAGLLAILLIWKINPAPFLAAGGVAGIAIAFAAKDTVANIFGGISIFLDRPFKVGDFIIIDNTERGEVITIGARTTKIKTRDDILISIPNSVMSSSKIVNETGIHPPLRIRVDVGLPYNCDLDDAEKILFDAISKNELILKNPKPRVRCREFTDSYIKTQVMGWVGKPVEKGRVTHQVIKQIKKDLDQAGIKTPFPQREIHLHQKSANLQG